MILRLLRLRVGGRRNLSIVAACIASCKRGEAMKRSSGNTENWRSEPGAILSFEYVMGISNLRGWRLEKRLQGTGGQRTEPAGGAGRAERPRRLHVTHVFTVSNSVYLDAAEKAADLRKRPQSREKRRYSA